MIRTDRADRADRIDQTDQILPIVEPLIKGNEFFSRNQEKPFVLRDSDAMAPRGRKPARPVAKKRTSDVQRWGKSFMNYLRSECPPGREHGRRIRTGPAPVCPLVARTSPGNAFDQPALGIRSVAARGTTGLREYCTSHCLIKGLFQVPAAGGSSARQFGRTVG